MSVSALVGENALFHCNGSGFTVLWIVDGLQENSASIIQRGISSVLVTLSGTVQSTLTVPATLVNNGTTVECRVVSLNGFAISNNATLTVLPTPGELSRTVRLTCYQTVSTGIGQVRNVRFNPSLSDVQWDPPLAAPSGLMYEVTTMDMNTGQIVVNKTTNNTFCPLPPLELCQNYIVNVTAFSSQQQGDSVVTDLRPEGSECVGCTVRVDTDFHFTGNYRFKTILSQELVFREPSIVEFLVTLRVIVC